MNDVAIREDASGAITPAIPQAQILQLEAIAEWCESLTRTRVGRFERAFCLAAAMQRLRGLITHQMMADVMALQGTPLGFLTDRDDRGGYPVEVVKEVAIEATLRGLRLVGNEINIIGGRCYVTKQGLGRLVRSWPGLADLRLEVRSPKIEQDWALVPCRATWTLAGQPQVLDCTGERAIPVRVNKGMIVDAVLGKAQRKLLARIYEQLCGDSANLVAEEEVGMEELAGGSQQAAGGTGHGAPCSPLPVEDYLQQVERAGDRRQIGQAVKTAAVDPQLSAQDRARIVAAANRRSAELRADASTRQQQLLDTDASATEAGW